MIELYPYQSRGIGEIDAAFADGVRRVLAVAPTGAGKGTMAAWMIARAIAAGQRCVFVVHRREIVRDIAKRLRERFGVRVGCVLPGERIDRGAPAQVASIQSLLAAKELPAADLLVLDEAHHYPAAEWGALVARYASAQIVGFTATPQRADGRAMGDAFDRLVVVASYSELLASGHIVPCDVLRPDAELGRDLAQSPLDAYLRYANGRKAFVYVAAVNEAIVLAKKFNAVGVPAQAIHANTPVRVRQRVLEDMASGAVRIVTNVLTMTEGIDVESVSAIVLARTCAEVGDYMQICGRALRRCEPRIENIPCSEQA